MAAAFCERLSGGRVEVRSAGSLPAVALHPVVVAAMAEVGIDLAAAVPRPLADDDVRAADVVITMGCGDACPVFPGKRYLDWAVPDPAGQTIEVVRLIRDELRALVEALLVDLGVDLEADRSSSLGSTLGDGTVPQMGG